MSKRHALIEVIERIIQENAALLNERPILGVRLRPDGVWIQERVNKRWVRGQYMWYPTLERAHLAAIESNRRAQAVAKKMAEGLPVREAIAATPFDPEWRTR